MVELWVDNEHGDKSLHLERLMQQPDFEALDVAAMASGDILAPEYAGMLDAYWERHVTAMAAQGFGKFLNNF